MKIISLIWAFLLFVSISSFSQSPNSFKYQSILRDKNGLLIADKTVTLRISILQTKIDGTTVYAETHSTKTSATGIINLEIGKGTIVSGAFNSILWGTNSHFVKIEMDPAGGSAFELVGTSQLLSVPYALFAQTSGDEKWDTATGGINYKGGNVGIANLNPLYKLDVAGSINATSFLLGGKAIVSSPWASTGSNLSFTTGNVGIGTSAPTVKLDIDGGSDLNLLNLRTANSSLGINAYVSSNTDFHGSAFIGRRSRGTYGAPTNTLAGDRITGIYGSLFAGGDYQNASAIEMYVGNNPGSASYPSNIRFGTTATNQTVRTERMRIAENGNIGIGTNNPGYLLDVAGIVNANSFLVNGQPVVSSLWSASANNISYSAGNVGVGTASPAYKLDVAGAINASSVLIGGNAIVSSPWATSLNSVSYTTGNVGIGTSSPLVKLDIDGGSDLNLLNLRTANSSLGINAYVSSNTDFHGSAFIGRRSRGTYGAPINTLAGDRITGIYGSLFAGGDYQNASAIEMYVGNNPGSASYPSNIRFGTTATNQTVRTERMRITENGNVEIQTGDVYIKNIGSGVIMKSPNGNCWRMTVSNTGVPIFIAITCP